MKLIRFVEPGNEKPGVILDNQIRVDASACNNDYQQFFAGDGLARLALWLKQNGSSARKVDK
jgi:2,4-didehydro-3-deoxy-L-rhamnonate hydrolase